jgi:hypothetical protein
MIEVDAMSHNRGVTVPLSLLIALLVERLIGQVAP